MNLLSYPYPTSIANNGGYVGNDLWQKYAAEYLKSLAKRLGYKEYKINKSSGDSRIEVSLFLKDKEIFFFFEHESARFSCMVRNISKGETGLVGRNHYFQWEDVRIFSVFTEKVRVLDDLTIKIPLYWWK